MKPAPSSKPLFDTAQVRAALDAAPDTAVFDVDNPPTTQADWTDTILSRGRDDLREKLAVRRVRGAGKKPAREQISLRLPPDVLARWRATGKGWQTRMAQVLCANAPGA